MPEICEHAAVDDTATATVSIFTALTEPRRRHIALPVSPLIDMSLFLVAKKRQRSRPQTTADAACFENPRRIARVEPRQYSEHKKPKSRQRSARFPSPDRAAGRGRRESLSDGS